MGAGFHGGFGDTKGARELYTGSSKSDALKSVSSLPPQVQKGAKSFFKGSSNRYNKYEIQKASSGNFIIKMENPGRVPGLKAVYYKILDPDGKTVRVYKETYDPDGKLVHRKEK